MKKLFCWRVGFGCLAALASSPLANSAELVMRDITIAVEELPTSFSYTLKDPTSTRTGTDAFSSGLGVTLGGRYSFAGAGDSSGFVAGAELTAAKYGYTGGGGLTAYGARGLGGYAYALSDRWNILAFVDVGVSSDNLTVSGQSAFDHYSASGLAYTYAARLGTGFAVTENLIVGVEAGYRATNAALKAGSTTIDLTSTGLTAMLNVSYRFFASPAPLE